MWDLLLRNRKFKIATGFIGLTVMLGLIGPMVTRSPEEKDYTRMFQPPSSDFILGTNAFGEDVFAQLCLGVRNSLMLGVLAGALGTLIAVLLGALGAYKGGLPDDISNFVTNIAIVFPVLPVLIILAAIMAYRSLFLVALLIALTSWPWASRSIRSQVLSLKEREFVDLARTSGMKGRRIVITEILPNMLAYIIMVFVLLVGGAIIAEAGISMIGLGPSGTVTLGQMLYWAMRLPPMGASWWEAWWWFVPPGVVLSMFLSSIFVMHAGMDEVFNPRLRRI